MCCLSPAADCTFVCLWHKKVFNDTCLFICFMFYLDFEVFTSIFMFPLRLPVLFRFVFGTFEVTDRCLFDAINLLILFVLYFISRYLYLYFCCPCLCLCLACVRFEVCFVFAMNLFLFCFCFCLFVSISIVSSSVCPAVETSISVVKQNELENTFKLIFQTQSEIPLQWVT
jgi:hypothetical protein